MRRAEKAGRERAEVWLSLASQMSIPFGPESLKRRIEVHAAQVTEHVNPHDLHNPTRENLGAHQLTGRALKAALEAYDRGYRARLAEALEGSKL